MRGEEEKRRNVKTSWSRLGRVDHHPSTFKLQTSHHAHEDPEADGHTEHSTGSPPV